jgi:hypothetical protein
MMPFAVATAALVFAALPISVQAASPSRVQHRAYSILQHFANGVLGVSDKAVRANASAVEKQLAPCVLTLLMPSITLSAEEALVLEMSSQYAVEADRPVYRALATAAELVAKLPPVSRRVKSKFKNVAELITGTLALNTCADVAAWQAASFAPSSEPAGTRLANDWLNPPTPSLADILSVLLTPSQQQAIAPLDSRASKHFKHLTGLGQNLAGAWLYRNAL